MSILGGSVTAQGTSGADTADAFLNVVAAGARPVALKVSLAALSAPSVTVVAVKPPRVQPGVPTRVEVTVGGLKKLTTEARGVLVVNAGGKSVDREISVTPGPQPAEPWAKFILIAAVGAAVGLFLLIVIVLASKNRAGRLLERAPGPKWSFDSWATTLTTVGAVLATVLAGATFPTVPRQIDKDTLVGLSLLFGALVVAAPFVFQAIRTPRTTAADQEAGEWGFNITLLLSCCITFGATLGELSALSLLAWELIGGGGWGWLAVVGLGLMVVLALWYFGLTAYQLASTQWSSVAEARSSVIGIAGEGDFQVVSRAPSWRLP
ncbi:MAG TPA: hypothetical protein VFU30_14935 [Gaiellaceae bacterium]|nr:hypothetical protein [Gaiellaceae bacterium]